MDAGEAPIGGDLYQVGPLVAVRNHVVDVVVEVKGVLVVAKVSLVLVVEREVKEGLIKVEVVMAMAIMTAAIRLGVISLPITVIVGPFIFTGQDLDWR